MTENLVSDVVIHFPPHRHVHHIHVHVFISIIIDVLIVVILTILIIIVIIIVVVAVDIVDNVPNNSCCQYSACKKCPNIKTWKTLL